MDSAQKEKANVLDVAVGPDGIVHLVIAGKYGKDELFSVVAWTEKVKGVLREVSLCREGDILLLCDIVHLTYFERSMIAPLRELLVYDKQFHLRSAIVGASPIVAAMIKALVSISGRTNVRLFKTEKEARAWLALPSPFDTTQDLLTPTT
jgi:hypothetical protein